MATGDLTASLLTRLRTLLDEASASYWSDNECYAALTDAQRELTAIFLSRYKGSGGGLPNVLRPLMAQASSSALADKATSVALPTGFMHLLSLKYDYSNADTPTGSLAPCVIRDPDNLFQKQNNVYTTSTAGAPVAWLDASNINFETAVVTAGSYTLEYIVRPTAIASGVDPMLPETCYQAMITFAFAELLTKDQRTQEAEQQFTRFYTIAQGLYA